MLKHTKSRHKSHPAINSSKRKKIWKIFAIRDTDQHGDILCSLCKQPTLYEDDSNDYNLEIGHINVQKPEYELYYNSNNEINLTPQHSICNKRLQGTSFYQKHEPTLIKTLRNNITWSKSKSTYNKEKVLDLLDMDSSSIQNKKTKLYTTLCQKYLNEIFSSKNPPNSILFETAENDITGLCKKINNFGSTYTVRRHLKAICNRLFTQYVIENNPDGLDTIRLMRPDEKIENNSFVDLFRSSEGGGLG